MEKTFRYPSKEQIIEYNLLALNVIQVKKKDSAKVLDSTKISHALRECEKAGGDLHLKAAVLLRALVRAHAFASGNRRTAFVTVKSFVLENGGHFAITDDPTNAPVLRGIREGYYSDDEIRGWIAHGKIRPFER